MKREIPISLLMDMIKASNKEGTLEMIDEGDKIRVKGMFSLKAEEKDDEI